VSHARDGVAADAAAGSLDGSMDGARPRDAGPSDVPRLPDGAVDPSLVPFASGSGDLVFFALLPGSLDVIVVAERHIVRVGLDGVVRHPVIEPPPGRRFYGAALVDGGLVVRETLDLMWDGDQALRRYSLELTLPPLWTVASFGQTLYGGENGLWTATEVRYRRLDPATGAVLAEGPIDVPRWAVPYELPGRDIVAFWRGGFDPARASFMPYGDPSATVRVRRLEVGDPPDYGFVGLHGFPTTEIIASDGVRYSFEDCLTTPEPDESCYREVGRLPQAEIGPPLFRTSRRFLASDPTITDSLFVIRGHRDSGCDLGLWGGPCMLTEMDVESGTVLREVGPFGLLGRLHARLAVLPDRSAVVVASFGRRRPDYAPGEGWDLYLVRM
jgi:hypothetical protein